METDHTRTSLSQKNELCILIYNICIAFNNHITYPIQSALNCINLLTLCHCYGLPEAMFPRYINTPFALKHEENDLKPLLTNPSQALSGSGQMDMRGRMSLGRMESVPQGPVTQADIVSVCCFSSYTSAILNLN